MKKTVQLALIAGLIFTFSCQKENPLTPVSQNQVAREAYDYDLGLDNIPEVSNQQDLEELMANTVDHDDEKINHLLFKLSSAIRPLMLDPAFAQVIIDMASNNPNHCANLMDLQEVNRDYFNAINDELDNLYGITLDDIASDLTHRTMLYDVDSETEAPNDDEVEQYMPGIFIPNYATANVDKQPLLSCAITANSDDDESLEDLVVMWYYNTEDDLREILVSEATAMATSNPIFVVENSVFNEWMVEETEADAPLADDDAPTAARATTEFHSHEFRINHRYESSGKSEYTLNVYRIDPSGVVHWIWHSNARVDIADVHKNDICKNIAKWAKHSKNYGGAYSTNDIFWNTYERDWINSNKALGTFYGNGGGPFYLSGNRKYTSEWYQYNPSASFTGKNTDLAYIYSNWAKWHNESKTKYRVWRVGA